MDDSEATDLLSAERARVEEALAALHPVADREHPDDGAQDQGESGEDLVTAAHDAGRRERLDEELRAIERAEQRLAHGRYGLSVESGDAIPDARLRAQPTAERTVAEQERLAR